MADDGRENTTVRLEPEFKKELKAKLAAEGISLQDLAEGMLREWLVGKRATAPAVGPRRTPRHGEDLYHEKLAFVFQHGDAEDRHGIQKNLDWAVSDIRSRKPESKRA